MTQILWKNVFQKFKTTAKIDFVISAAILDFQKYIFLTNFASFLHRKNAKKIEKIKETQSYAKKSDFDPPF
jgi:hypothetical protein